MRDSTSGRARSDRAPARPTTVAAVTTDRAIPPLAADDHVAGPHDAALELVMYGDFQCPYCAAAQSILRRVRERLDGRLRFAFRHMTLPEVHPQAQLAAQASEAAAAQDTF